MITGDTKIKYHLYGDGIMYAFNYNGLEIVHPTLFVLLFSTPAMFVL